MIVRRCSTITASEYLALVLRTKADRSRAKTKFLLAYELLFAPARFAIQNNLLRTFNVPAISYSGRGDRVRTRFSVMTGCRDRRVRRNATYRQVNERNRFLYFLYVKLRHCSTQTCFLTRNPIANGSTDLPNIGFYGRTKSGKASKIKIAQSRLTLFCPLGALS